MPTITSPGIGSGLDVNGIVSQLVALERAPLDKMQSAATDIQNQISAFGKVKSMVSAVGDAAAALRQTSLWQQTTATSSDAASVAVTSSGGAAAASYAVQVVRLAQAHNLASAAVADSTASVGTGKLHIELGEWNADHSAFTPKAGATAVDVDIVAGADSLEAIRDKINAASAGVTAAIVRDASGARLTLRSAATGAVNAMRISAFDADGNPTTTGLGTLAYDPASGVNALAETQSALDAQATINGLSIVSASNTLTNVVDGVTLTLAKPTATPVTVTVGADSAGMRNAITAFVSAYNTLNTYLAQQTKYDDATKTAGTLQGDSAAVGLRNQMRNLLGATSGASTAFARLADVGFDVQRDGTISINNTRLDAGLANLPELTKLFSGSDDSAPGLLGFGVQFDQFADQVTGSDGLLASRNDGLNARLKRNQNDQDRLNDHVAQVQARLLRQYTALDTQLGQLNGLSSYVTAQMAVLNKK